MCLSYFGRSTCLLRPFNVLTSADQRAYFGRSKTNSSDKKTSFTASKGNIAASLGLFGGTSAQLSPMSFAILSNRRTFAFHFRRNNAGVCQQPNGLPQYHKAEYEEYIYVEIKTVPLS